MADRTIPRETLLEAVRTLGFDPDEVRSIVLTPGAVAATVRAYDPDGNRIWAGDTLATNRVTVKVED